MATKELILKNETDAGSGYSSIIAPTGGSKTQTSAFGTMKMFAKATAIPALAISTFKWQASLVGRNTGNSDLQQKIDAGMTIAGQVGMIAGGFAVGGLIGGMAAIAGVGLSYAKETEANMYNRKWENIGITQRQLRAGPSLNRSRT